MLAKLMTITQRSLFTTLFVSTLVTIATPAIASEFLEETYQPIIKLHQQAVDGDGTARDQAFEQFEQLNQVQPTDPLSMVYLGSTLALKGRDAWLPWKKMSFTEKGLDLMAKAVSILEPEDDDHLIAGMPVSIRVKSLAAINFTSVPGFFNRFDQGNDWLQQLTESESMKNLPFAQIAYIHYYAGIAAESDKQYERALTYFQRVIDELKYGELVTKAQQRINDISDKS